MEELGLQQQEVVVESEAEELAQLEEAVVEEVEVEVVG